MWVWIIAFLAVAVLPARWMDRSRGSQGASRQNDLPGTSEGPGKGGSAPAATWAPACRDPPREVGRPPTRARRELAAGPRGGQVGLGGHGDLSDEAVV